MMIRFEACSVDSAVGLHAPQVPVGNLSELVVSTSACLMKCDKRVGEAELHPENHDSLQFHVGATVVQ